MKGIRKAAALFLSAVMVAASSVSVFAADGVDNFIDFIKDSVTVDGNVVTLNNDITLSECGIEIQKEYVPDGVTIDLNNKTVTVTSDINAIHNYDADVTLKNGTIKMQMADGIFNEDAYAVYNDNGTLTVENVTIEGDRGALYNVLGKMTVTSGTFSTKQYQAVYNAGGDVTVNGGTFANGVYNVSGMITLNDGTFNGNVYTESKGNVVVGGIGDREAGLVINGGSFKNKPSGSKITIKDGYEAVMGEDGRYVLAEKGPEPDYIAEYTFFNVVKCETREDVAKALSEGRQVKLLSDIPLDRDFHIDNSGYLDLNGFDVNCGAYTVYVDGGQLVNYNKDIQSMVDSCNIVGQWCGVEGNLRVGVMTVGENGVTVYESTQGSPAFDKIDGNVEKSKIYAPGTKFLIENFGDKNDPNALINKIPNLESDYKTLINAGDGYYQLANIVAKNTATNEKFITPEEAFASTIGSAEPVEIKLTSTIKSDFEIPEGANVSLYANSNLDNKVVITNNGTLTIKKMIGKNTSNVEKKNHIVNNGTCYVEGNPNVYAILEGEGTYILSGGYFYQDTIPENWVAPNCILIDYGSYKMVGKITLETGSAIAKTGANETEATGFVTTITLGNKNICKQLNSINWTVTANDGTEGKTGEIALDLTDITATQIKVGLIVTGLNDENALASASLNGGKYVE